MNHLFYNTFQIENMPLIFLCGDETLELLRTVLAREIAGQGKKALLAADFPIEYPIEGQILVNIEPEILSQKIARESSQIFYLCGEVQNNLLYPVSESFFKEFAPYLTSDMRIVSTIKKISPAILKEFSLNGAFSFINAFGYGNFGEHLSSFYSDLEQGSKHLFEDDLKLHWKKWVSRFCPQSEIDPSPSGRILFFNQIKSLIDENRVIPLVRGLRNFYDKVFIGDINEYKLKEI